MDTKKYETVVAYVCRIATKKEKNLNKTTLVKTVWLADIFNFARYGVTITADDIIRRDYGPVNRNIFDVIDSATKKNIIARRVTGYLNETVYEAGSDPKLDGVLEPHEVAHINDASNMALDKTATELSDFSHEFEAWKNHKNGDVIEPVEFLMRSADFDEEDDAFVKENEHLFV